MSTKQMRALFIKARRLAADLARRCDFVTLSRISDAKASCCPGGAVVCVEYKDGVERAQAITAFAYGASLLGMDLMCDRREDIIMDGGPSLVTINLSKEGK